MIPKTIRCKLCGEEIPRFSWQAHIKESHPSEWKDMMEKRKLKRRARKKGEDTSVVPAAPDGLTATEDLDAHKPESENHSNGHSKDPKDAMGTAVRVQFVQRTIQVDARILLLYNLCRQRFPTYVASEGEWLLDIVSRYFAEHAEDFGLDATTLLSSVRSELEGAQP